MTPPAPAPHRSAALDRIERRLAETAIRLSSRLGRLVPPRVVDGLVLDREVQMMLLGLKVRGARSLTQGSIAAARARMRRDARLYRGPVTEVAAVHDISIPGAATLLPARHYVPPKEAKPRPLVVFFHGGGFILGDLDTHDEPCRLLCRHAGVHVLAIDYRLAPEHPFPAGVDDALAAFRWARANAAALGADPLRVGVAGDSAGGNLSAVVALTTARAGEPTPCLQLLVYPVVDSSRTHPSRERFGEGFFLTAEDIASFTREYLGPTQDRADPRVSPLLAKDLSGLPPAIIATAAFDPLRDEGEAYAEALRAAGNVVELRRADGLVHGFINMSYLSRVSRQKTLELVELTRGMLERSAS